MRRSTARRLRPALAPNRHVEMRRSNAVPTAEVLADPAPRGRRTPATRRERVRGGGSGASGGVVAHGRRSAQLRQRHHRSARLGIPDIGGGVEHHQERPPAQLGRAGGRVASSQGGRRRSGPPLLKDARRRRRPPTRFGVTAPPRTTGGGVRRRGPAAACSPTVVMPAQLYSLSATRYSTPSTTRLLFNADHVGARGHESRTAAMVRRRDWRGASRCQLLCSPPARGRCVATSRRRPPAAAV